MLEMILLVVSACGLVAFAVSLDRKTHTWHYVVDNVSIGECRSFNNLAEAYNIWQLCLEDGHETYLKRIRV